MTAVATAPTLETPAAGAGYRPLSYFSRRAVLEFGADADGWERGVLEQDVIAAPGDGGTIRPFAERVEWRAAWKLTYRRANEPDYATYQVPAMAAKLEIAQTQAEDWLKHLTELYDVALNEPVPEWERRQPGVPNENHCYYRIADRILRVSLDAAGEGPVYRASDLGGARVATCPSLPALLGRVAHQFQTQDDQGSKWRRQSKYKNVALTLPEIRNVLLPILKERKVEQAIVFGSYGRGTAHHGSDIDLLLVVDTEATGSERWREYARVSTVWGRATQRDIDMVLVTKEEFNRILNDPDSPLSGFLKAEGRIIYERDE